VLENNANQGDLPNFTTAQSEFNFRQIFSENIFVGGDRVNNANALTAAVTTRFFEDATGRSVNECGQLFQLDGRHAFVIGQNPRDLDVFVNRRSAHVDDDGGAMRAQLASR
jgi:lipopolysaccharide assembly outer membrane protein LptD (OstA)